MIPPAAPKPHLLLIYSSQTGRTQALIEAVERGAAPFAEVRLLPALQATLEDLRWAQGLIIASPENFGYLSGAVKDFLDRTYYPAQNLSQGLPYALIISAGNDGSGAVRALERIAIGYGWKAIQPAWICRGIPSAADLEMAEALGEALAVGVGMGVF
jgi:flavorubredoxin